MKYALVARYAKKAGLRLMPILLLTAPSAILRADNRSRRGYPLSASEAPEPKAMTLVGAGLVALGLIKRNKRFR